ncbi:MAG: MFS transporter [Bacteroidales bacterium]|nr:MFS transporter [Bacteroidales bacterium]MBN2633708.1 MFS transporter [Bacteroidales bacterium]
MMSHGKTNEAKVLKRSVLLVASFAAFLTPFLGSAVNLALPAIGRDLNANAISLGWVISSFTLSSAVFLLPFGRLGDIRGRKKVFSLGIILFTVSTFLILFSGSISYLIVMRIVQGLAGAMIFGTSLAILTSVFPPGERGHAMGITITSTYFGLSAGPVIGGFLTESFGWKSIFAFLVPLGIISLWFIYRKMKGEWAEAKGEKFDWKGSLVYGVSLSAFMYGFSILPSTTGWVLIIAGILIAIFFVLYEKNVDHPVFDIGLVIRNRVLGFSGLAALIHYAATSATGFFISLYLQYLKDLDARTAGLIMISQPIAMALLSPLAGRLSDRMNPGVIASSGMALTAVGLIFLCFINGSTSFVYIIVLLVIMGIGFGLFSSPNSNAIMSSVEKKHLGIASGIVGTMRMIGQMTSMGIAMMLISLFMGKETINPSTYPNLITATRTGFVIFSILSVAGIFASLARNRKLASG